MPRELPLPRASASSSSQLLHSLSEIFMNLSICLCSISCTYVPRSNKWGLWPFGFKQLCLHNLLIFWKGSWRKWSCQSSLMCEMRRPLKNPGTASCAQLVLEPPRAPSQLTHLRFVYKHGIAADQPVYCRMTSPRFNMQISSPLHSSPHQFSNSVAKRSMRDQCKTTTSWLTTRTANANQWEQRDRDGSSAKGAAVAW